MTCIQSGCVYKIPKYILLQWTLSGIKSYFLCKFVVPWMGKSTVEDADVWRDL